MKYLSVCSGIEAASVAWNPLGWEAVAYSEIEPFPSAVLAHHYPETPNWGDMTKFEEWPDANVDVLAGGTPCQSFSVAGLRSGLDDPRGNLMLTYLAIAARYRPRWLVWENVPGVLSSNGGRDFGAFLRGLGECGYGWCYRVLDAQYFGLAQRRRRVFVVGHLGDWRAAAAVLLEPESLQGNPAPGREAGEGVAPSVSTGAPFSRTGNERVEGEAVIPEWPAKLAPTLNAHFGEKQGLEDQHVLAGAGLFVPCITGDKTRALTGEGFDASEDGTGRGTPLVPNVAGTLKANSGGGGFGSDPSETFVPVPHVDTMPTMQNGADTPAGHNARSGHTKDNYIVPMAFDTTQVTSKENRSNPQPGDPCHPLSAGAHAPAVAFKESQSGVREGGVHATLDANKGSRRMEGVREGKAVRRLTPRECERLMGFPDDYTLIPTDQARSVEADWLRYIRCEYPSMSEAEAKRMSKDGPRYKALGNSWAVPCAAWIGRRIALFEEVRRELESAA